MTNGNSGGFSISKWLYWRSLLVVLTERLHFLYVTAIDNAAIILGLANSNSNNNGNITINIDISIRFDNTIFTKLS